MSSYTKLFQSILTSTIWSEDHPTRIVWITMLAMANRHGEVEASIPGLARIAGVPIDATEAAIKKFESPDPYSRTADFEGRRIEAIDGGWLILNYEKYRNRASEEDRREQDRLRKRRVRSCPQLSAVVRSESAVVRTESAMSAQAEAEAEAKKEEEGGASAPGPSLPPEIQEWNSHGELPAVRSVSKSLLAKLHARRKDQFFAEHWREAIQRICQSQFCLGHIGRGWKADFDWFIQPDTVAKVMEGKYDGTKPEPPRNAI